MGCGWLIQILLFSSWPHVALHFSPLHLTILMSFFSLQIECMVASEIMQRYKKLQFERGKWPAVLVSFESHRRRLVVFMELSFGRCECTSFYGSGKRCNKDESIAANRTSEIMLWSNSASHSQPGSLGL